MPDVLGDLRNDLEKRLKALAPIVEEHAHLLEALGALKDTGSQTRRATTTAAPPVVTKDGTRNSGRSRVAGGAAKQASKPVPDRATVSSVDGSAHPPRKRTPRGPASKPDAAAIFAAIEKAQIPVSVERIRELASVPKAVSSNAMRTALKRLVDGDRVVRSGQRRGTRYAIR